jgi:hypothetical protein
MISSYYRDNNNDDLPEIIKLDHELRSSSSCFKAHLAAADNLQSHVQNTSDFHAHMVEVGRLYFRYGYSAQQISDILAVDYDLILQDIQYIENIRREENYNARKASMDRRRHPPYGSAAGVAIFF